MKILIHLVQLGIYINLNLNLCRFTVYSPPLSLNFFSPPLFSQSGFFAVVSHPFSLPISCIFSPPLFSPNLLYFLSSSLLSLFPVFSLLLFVKSLFHYVPFLLVLIVFLSLLLSCRTNVGIFILSLAITFSIFSFNSR